MSGSSAAVPGLSSDFGIGRPPRRLAPLYTLALVVVKLRFALIFLLLPANIFMSLFVLNPSGWASFFHVMAFVLTGATAFAGLIGLFTGIAQLKKTLRLLRDGLVASGRVVRVGHDDGDEIPSGRRGPRYVVAWTHSSGAQGEVAAAAPLSSVDRGDNEPVLFLPGDESTALVLDELPGGPRLSDDGVVRPKNLSGFVVLIAPLGVLLTFVGLFVFAIATGV